MPASRPFPTTVSFCIALLLAVFPAARADDLKTDAIQRLSGSHDPQIPVALGRVYLRQTGIRAVRARLARAGREAGLGRDWTPAHPRWADAESLLMTRVDDIVGRRLESGTWLQEAWGREADRMLNAEEADELAHHFATPAGREQRRVIELLIVGETVMASYTMTGRLDYGMPETRADYDRLQQVWWDHDPFGKRDFTGDAGAMRFVSRDPGIKYTKMLAIRGSATVIDHLEQLAGEIRSAVEAPAPEVDAAVAAARR